MISNPFLFLRRIRHSAGFGIQSPSDYAFVREVIYEHWPYSAYADLEQKYPDVSPVERWKLQLLLRVANWAQTDHIFLFGSNPAMIDYLHAGCSKSFVLPSPQLPEEMHAVDAMHQLGRRIREMHKPVPGTPYWNTEPLIIVDDIQGAGKKTWEKVKTIHHVITFDLYYVGIAYHRLKRYSEHHVINPY